MVQPHRHDGIADILYGPAASRLHDAAAPAKPRTDRLAKYALVDSLGELRKVSDVNHQDRNQARKIHRSRRSIVLRLRYPRFYGRSASVTESQYVLADLDLISVFEGSGNTYPRPIHEGPIDAAQVDQVILPAVRELNHRMIPRNEIGG